jgi:hypothetical protein
MDVCGFILVLEAGMGRFGWLCFLTQSVETIENKRVEFFVSAKKCKRVWKKLKRKGIGRKTLEGWNVEEKRLKVQS